MLNPKREFVFTISSGTYRLTIVEFTTKDTMCELRYRISPPFPDAVATGGQYADKQVFIEYEVFDEADTIYFPVGGAYGTSPDGTTTVGTLRAEPGVPLGLNLVTFKIQFSQDGSWADPFYIPLPLVDRQ